MFFNNLLKPWWLAWLVTWLIAVVVLQARGMQGRVMGVTALLIASVVAIGVWFALRDRFPAAQPAAGAPPPVARPARKAKPKRRR